MFPTTETTFSARFKRGLERAVQFATLGEYGAPEPAGPPAPRARSRARVTPAPAWRAPRSAVAVGPATAAARRGAESSASAATARRNEPPKSVSARAALRDLGLRSSGAAAPRRRTRVGQPTPRPQVCTTPLPR
jgi:hypothetical protein